MHPTTTPGAVTLPGRSLHAVFRVRVREAPERIALSTSTETISYGELDARSDRLAAHLTALGVGPDVLVGLCAGRTPEAVVGMLGILKAGGAYVPVDPSYPAERIRFLLLDCALSIVVAAKAAAGALGAHLGAVVLIDGAAVTVDDRGGRGRPAARGPAPADGHALAYVIHTSGSTGVPKGVAVEHRNVVRLFEQTHALFRFDHRDTWTLFHSISFDFSVWEIWGALLYGGRLVLLPEAASRSPALLISLLRSERVTVLNQTPSAFHQLQTALWPTTHPGPGVLPPCLRLLVFGGERLDPRLLGPWIERHGDQLPELVNMYGITETTVHCTYRRIRVADLDAGVASPIGVPIPDVRVHVLGADGEPAQDGEPGEMWIGGAGVARGYLNRPELTRERFTTVPALGDERLYRSGDLGVRLPNGELAFLGRADDQLKVRGYRIEPGEVEHCLSRLPGIARAAVVPRDFGAGDVRLVAYLVPADEAVTGSHVARQLAADVERHAMASLPRHLRPSLYELVAEIPLTLHGKVDRDALGR